jgi:indolepyruvate ferredoxin oxidoreductase alpha subunit
MRLEKKVSLLKMGIPYPLDEALCLDFMKDKEIILVFEESDPFLENQVRILAQMRGTIMPIHGQLTGDLERPGEMNFERTVACLEKVFHVQAPEKKFESFRKKAQQNINNRPLTMCSGCPHRATHMALVNALKKLKVKKPIIFGDIGCYELGHEPPFDDMDSIYNMGAGVGLANGIAHSGVKEPVIALIGDSTLLHSGLPGFTNAIHGKADITMIVFDNATIAMTGHQAPVNSNRTLMGDEAPAMDIAATLWAAKASFVQKTSAFNIKETQNAIEEAIQTEGPSAVVVQGACALEHDRTKRKQGIVIEPYKVDAEKCVGCRICTDKFGCPALIWNEETEKVDVDAFVCNGCGVCVQICPNEAFIIE